MIWMENILHDYSSLVNKIHLFIFSYLITSQDVSPYHCSSAELVLIGVEPETMRFRVDVITHYTTAPQLIDYHVTRVLNAPRDRAMRYVK